jgi:hypothetical protein
MKLEHKIEQILRLVPLGISLEKAFLIAECTFDEIEDLKKDELFQAKLKVEEALEEKRLLEVHKEACETAAAKGVTSGIQWKLSKLYPNKWGSDTTDNNKDKPGQSTVVYLPENNR